MNRHTVLAALGVYLWRQPWATLAGFVAWGLITWLWFVEPDPILLMSGYAVSLSIVASRLRAMNDYSAAYLLPHYRTVQLTVGMSLVALFGWLPILMVDIAAISVAERFALLAASTGALLLANLLAPRLLVFGWIALIATVVASSVLNQGVSFALPAWLAAGLSLVGVLSLVTYCRLTLAGSDYRSLGVYSQPDIMVPLIDSSGARSGWVSNHDYSRHARSVAPLRFSVDAVLTRRVRQFRESRNSLQAYARLFSVASGLRHQLTTATIAYVCGFLGMALLATVPAMAGFARALPFVLGTWLGFGLIWHVVGLLEAFRTWPAARMWMTQRIHHPEDFFLAAALTTGPGLCLHLLVAATVGLGLTAFADSVHLFLPVLGVTLGCMLQTCCFGFLLWRVRYMSIALVGMLLFESVLVPIAIVTTGGLAPGAAVVFVTGLVSCLVATRWWMHGFFARQGNAMSFG